MSKDKKPKNFQAITPKGVFKFPNLTKPDFGTKEYPKEGGEYNTRLVMSLGEAQDLIDKLQPEMDRAEQLAKEKFAEMPVATRKKLGAPKAQDFYQEIYDKETEEPTGEVEFRFSMKASGKNEKGEKWERKPTIFDAKGKPVTLKSIWGGSKGKVSFEAVPYFVAGTGVYGIKLYLRAVQVIELNQGGSRSASDFGFGEEDGFDGSEVDNSEGFNDESTEGEDEGAGDDATGGPEDF